MNYATSMAFPTWSRLRVVLHVCHVAHGILPTPMSKTHALQLQSLPRRVPVIHMCRLLQSDTIRSICPPPPPFLFVLPMAEEHSF